MVTDTTAQARQVQEEIFRGMTASERLKMALEMSDSLRNIALAGLLSRQPELRIDESSREMLRIMYGFSPQS